MFRIPTRVGVAALCVFISTRSLAATDAIAAVISGPSLHAGSIERQPTLDITRAGSRLVAVGVRGAISLSDDDGLRWRQVTAPTAATLTAVQFVNAKQGWAVGHFGVVIHTNDSGETWVRQLDGKKAAATAVAYFSSTPEKKAQLQAAQQLVDDGPDKPFLALHFDDEKNGFIIGAYNLIFRTNDGGLSWTPWQAHVENPQGLHLYAIQKIDNDWYIAGEQGLLLRSRGGPDQFVQLKSPYSGSFFGLLKTSQGNLLAFGLKGNAFRSIDGGDTWRSASIPVPASLNAGLALNKGIFLANQIGQVLFSADDGQTFKPQADVPPLPFTALLADRGGSIVASSMGGVVKFIPSSIAASLRSPKGGN